MPHYENGTEARVGDYVTGQLKNTEGIVAGVIISITPGSDFCNAMVQYTVVQKVAGVRPRMAIAEPGHDGIFPRVRYREFLGEKHGTEGEPFVAFECADYCETSGLTKVGP